MTLEEIRFLIAVTSCVGIGLLLFTAYWEGKHYEKESATGISPDAPTDDAACEYALRNIRCGGAGSDRSGAGGVTQ